MEALIGALRSAVSAIGDYGIWIGILVFIMVLGYGVRNKNGQPSAESAYEPPKNYTPRNVEEIKKDQRRKFIGGVIFVLLLIVFFIWFIS